MSLIQAGDLAKSFGAQDVFEEVSLSVPRQLRAALVGPNGVGKTTLLRILAGLESPDRGRVQRARGLRLGYLPQEGPEPQASASEPGLSTWQYCEQAFRGLKEREQELARLEAAMSDPQRAPQAIERYGPLQEAFERDGGYTFPSRIRQVLNGLGLGPDTQLRPLDRLSGGERTRAVLARLLLEDPDLLLLDEPTNHLDMEAIEWLEGWLREWAGAAVVVSHDRYFLDRTVDVVWELSARGLEEFRGDYSAYARQRQERLREQWDAYQAQQQHVEREREYIRRNIAGQNTRQAQGRRKRLERMLREQAVRRPEQERELHLSLRAVDRSGDQVLTTHGLQVGFPEAPEPLFRVPDIILRRGECAALIGPNGAGKTTFLRTLLGEVPPKGGEVRLGSALHLGYLAQAQEGLRPDATVLEMLQSAAPDLRVSRARDLLAKFLFRGDAVEKMVEVLSGGERARLALAMLAVEGANLLLLDEPTTHLDLSSQEALQATLGEFPGTVLLVSHDRYLIDALATQIWAIDPEGGTLTVFEGDYAAYTAARRLEQESRRAAPRVQAHPRPPSPRRKLAQMQALEERITLLERELADVARDLERAGSSVDRVRALGERYASLEAELEEQIAAWGRLGNADEPA